MRDGLKFSKALRKKIEEYATTEHFAQSKTGKTKLTRALDLVSGTNPRILQQLGITDIPQDAYRALLSVRGKDEKTVQGLEIFKTSGAGKLTGHHGTPAAAIGRALAVMKPDDQEYVFKSLEDMYVKHGMDPAGILAVDGKEVHMAAHGGDWTGQRTGASLKPVPGEKGKDFVKRFSSAYDIQMDLNEKAMDMPLTKDWDAAFEGGANAMGINGTDLNSSTTPAQIRQGATRILKPSADEVKAIVQSNSGNLEQIRTQTQKIVSAGLGKLNQPNRRLLSTIQGLATPNGIQSAAQRWGRQNLNMQGLGGVAGLMLDQDAAKKFAQGDILGGLQTGAGSAAKGEVISQGLQQVARFVGPRVGSLMAGVGQVAGPVAGAYAGTQVANELVKAGTGEGFVKKIQNVQDKTRTKSINTQAQQTTQQLAIKRKRTGQDQSAPDQIGNAIHSTAKMVDKGLNHLEYAIKNPLSIFGIK